MADLVEAYASACTIGDFWTNLSAILTDEVVIAEAQAAGMDWPEFAEGRKRLAATRHSLVTVAWSSGWISRNEVRVFTETDPVIAMEAARPWLEREQRAAFAEVLTPDPGTTG